MKLRYHTIDFIRLTIGLISSIVLKLYFLQSKSVTVFMFHDVTDRPSQFALDFGLHIPTKIFEDQCNWIKKNFNVVHPKDLLNGVKLPKKAAVISFDDGFLGSFENGLSILKRLGLPSIIFLNMGSILVKKPLISTIACYLEKYVSNRTITQGWVSPFHLSISPEKYLKLVSDKFYSSELEVIYKYQGSLVDYDTLKYWELEPLVCYGNHLYEHWNSTALSEDELIEQYSKNDLRLRQFKNFVNMFAFTNGQPDTCFTSKEVRLIKNLGAAKSFSGVGGVNFNYNKDFLLGRISIGLSDSSSVRLWFRIFQGLFARKKNFIKF